MHAITGSQADEILRCLGRIADALEAIADVMPDEPETPDPGRKRTPQDPAKGWCKAQTKQGNRCQLDAARDGMCKTHWRIHHQRVKEQRRVDLLDDCPW